jgi:uncharacterized protein (DUF427 family)
VAVHDGGGTMQAIWNGVVLAESDDTVVVEGNHYFPADSLNRAHFTPSSHQSACPWKGRASYYTVRVGDAVNADAAWYYPDPKPAARQIRGRVAFWKGVKVVNTGGDRHDRDGDRPADECSAGSPAGCAVEPGRAASTSHSGIEVGIWRRLRSLPAGGGRTFGGLLDGNQ